MKRFLGLILVVCLMLSLVSEALAAPNWEITEQTKCVTTKKSITLTVKVKGKGIKYQWVFVNPDDPDDTVTGKNLAKDKRFKGIKVSGYTKNKVVLTKVPEALHGWTVYCHLYSNAYKMDSDPVAIGVYGLEPPEQPEKPEKPAADEDGEPATSGDDGEDDGEDEDGTSAYKPQDFTVTSNGNFLFKLDAMGNPEGDTGVSSLTFTDSGNVAVRSENPFTSWTINGVRFEPENEVTGFKLFNLSSNTSISVKAATKTAATATVDDSVKYTITCTGCKFTYMPSKLISVTTGEVPSGALINVFADNSEAAANGYIVNGDEPQALGASSLQITVTGDTEIVVK